MDNFEIQLGLPAINVKRVEEHNGEIHIYVETTELATHCHSCGKKICKSHGSDNERKIRHLPILGKPTYIIYNPNRYLCDDCNRTTTATPPWHKQNSPFSLDYENHVLMELINSTVVDVSVKESLTEASVVGVTYHTNFGTTSQPI